MLPLNTAATANGNLLQKSNPNGSEQYEYNGLNQLTQTRVGNTVAEYIYNANGIRTSKQVGTSTTYYLLDGGDVVAEYTDGALTASYQRGINLISRTTTDGTEYYLHNAHGDVVALTNSSGTVTKRYDYDAFGNEENPSDSDTNPFRYCGEYFDKETKTYYLRARYYDPTIGRFTQQDTHWSPANAIYGDNPRKINERQDALGLNTYAYAPEITAIMQSGNLYVYCVNNPILYTDSTGEEATRGQIHDWVVYDIVARYQSIDMIASTKINYSIVPKKSSKYGLADLVSLKTGEVWEVKRITVSWNSAIEQLGWYVANRLNKKGFEEMILTVGGTRGTYILPNAIFMTMGDTIYFVFYWDCGSGIVYYNYVKLSSKDIEAAVAAGAITMMASYAFVAMQNQGSPLKLDMVCVEGEN